MELQLKPKDSILKDELAKKLSEEIKETAQEIIDMAIDINPELKNLSFGAIKNSLIESANEQEMAQIFYLVGVLDAKFDIVEQFSLSLDKKAYSAEQWSDLFDAFLNDKYPPFIEEKDQK